MPGISRPLYLHAVNLIRLVLLVCIGIASLPWFCSAAAAPITTYEIKSHKEKTGGKGLIVKEIDSSTSTLVKDTDGKVILDSKHKKVERYKYTYEILEMEADKTAIRIRRTYEKAQITKDGVTTTLYYEGKTVLIEKKGPKYHFSIDDGKELTAEEADGLAKEFDKPEDKVDPDTVFLPSKAVAPGESWKIDIDNFTKYAGSQIYEFDNTRSAGTGKLVRAYRKDGKTFGVIEVKVDLPTLAVGEAPDKIVLKNGARTSYTFTLDGCIDGTAGTGSMTGTINIKGSGVIKGPDDKDYVVDLEVDSSIRTSGEDQPR